MDTRKFEARGLHVIVKYQNKKWERRILLKELDKKNENSSNEYKLIKK